MGARSSYFLGLGTSQLQSLTRTAVSAVSGAILMPPASVLVTAEGHDERIRQLLASTLEDAARHQQHTPGYQAELTLWTRRYAGGRDGIPIGAVPPPPTGRPAGGSPRRSPGPPRTRN